MFLQILTNIWNLVFHLEKLCFYKPTKKINQLKKKTNKTNKMASGRVVNLVFWGGERGI